MVFEKGSGQLISKEKCSILFSNNTDDRWNQAWLSSMIVAPAARHGDHGESWIRWKHARQIHARKMDYLVLPTRSPLGPYCIYTMFDTDSPRTDSTDPGCVTVMHAYDHAPPLT
jgi:hypothetical protein